MLFSIWVDFDTKSFLLHSLNCWSVVDMSSKIMLLGFLGDHVHIVFTLSLEEFLLSLIFNFHLVSLVYSSMFFFRFGIFCRTLRWVGSSCWIFFMNNLLSFFISDPSQMTTSNFFWLLIHFRWSRERCGLVCEFHWKERVNFLVYVLSVDIKLFDIIIVFISSFETLLRKVSLL